MAIDMTEYEKAADDIKKRYNQYGVQAETSINSSYAPSMEEIKNEQKQLTSQYDTQRKANDYNLIVAAKKYNENMANIGNLQGGLNRSGQAQLQASASKTAGDINLSQQEASNNLTTALSKVVAERDAKVFDTKISYQQAGEDSATGYLQSMQQSEIEKESAIQTEQIRRETEIQKAQIEQQTQLQKEQISANKEITKAQISAKASAASSKDTQLKNYINTAISNAKTYGKHMIGIYANNEDIFQEIYMSYYDVNKSTGTTTPKNSTAAYTDSSGKSVSISELEAQTALASAGLSYMLGQDNTVKNILFGIGKTTSAEMNKWGATDMLDIK